MKNLSVATAFGLSAAAGLVAVSGAVQRTQPAVHQPVGSLVSSRSERLVDASQASGTMSGPADLRLRRSSLSFPR